MNSPDRVAFTVFGKDIYWYAILISIGIIVAAILAKIESKRKNLHNDTVIDMCLWAIPLGLIFARLYYVVWNLGYYLDNPSYIYQVWRGGLAIPGGLLGGVLGVFIYSRIKKTRLLRLLDCAAPGVAIAQAIGRWGNYINQEAFGPEVTANTVLKLPFGIEIPNLIKFPFVVRIDTVVGGEVIGYSYHLATFFYESMACLIIFAVIMLMRKKFKHDGDAILTYALLYSFERMFIEGLRTDSLMLGSIRITQLLCAVVFVAILAFFIVRAIREKKLGGAVIWPKPYVVPCTESVAENEQNADVDTDTDNESVDTANDEVEDAAVIDEDDEDDDDTDDEADDDTDEENE